MNKMFCIECGHEINYTSRPNFCPSCGFNFNGAAKVLAKKVSTPKIKKNEHEEDLDDEVDIDFDSISPLEVQITPPANKTIMFGQIVGTDAAGRQTLQRNKPKQLPNIKEYRDRIKSNRISEEI